MGQNRCVVFPRPEDTTVVHNIKHRDGGGSSDLTLDSFGAKWCARREALLSLLVLLLLACAPCPVSSHLTSLGPVIRNVLCSRVLPSGSCGLHQVWAGHSQLPPPCLLSPLLCKPLPRPLGCRPGPPLEWG